MTLYMNPSTVLALSYGEALTEEELQRQKDIVLARKYHEGLIGADLTDRLKEYLQKGDYADVIFRMNLCKGVVKAVAERLKVTGFNSQDKDLIEWAWDVWQENNLDAIQEEVYEAALRDGEHFVIVSWDNEKGVPTFLPHPRFTSVDAGGDGYGCWVKYTEDDPNQEPLYAVKQWTKHEDNKIITRKTIYYPDRVEKWYRYSYTDWERYTEEDEVWPIPWTRRGGDPIGIAVVPFNNRALEIEAWDAFPLQNAANKALVDLMATSDQSAFRILYSLGFVPTSDGQPAQQDGSNLLKVKPGTVVATTKSRRDAEFGSIEPTDLNQLIDLTHQIVLWLAMVTNTPVSRFISTKLIASDATLKEQEGPLIARATARQKSFGNSWSSCLNIARVLNNEYGEDEMVEDLRIDAIWAEAAARGEREKLEILELKQKLRIPDEQLWIEMGYDQATIERMKEARDEQRREWQQSLRDGAGTTGEAGGSEDGTGDSSGDAESSE